MARHQNNKVLYDTWFFHEKFTVALVSGTLLQGNRSKPDRSDAGKIRTFAATRQGSIT
ncbi:MAG: hypothetical protein WC391_01125 [Methanoregula sp.]|jgi:hypothetical protein